MTRTTKFGREFSMEEFACVVLLDRGLQGDVNTREDDRQEFSRGIVWFVLDKN